MLVVVIAGPIASGKSALGREVASRLQGSSRQGGSVIDLDLVYEMLDPHRRSKDDLAIWTQARRIAGRLASVLLAEEFAVVAEGDFATDRELREFETELPENADVRLVMLTASPDTALERARADATRGASKDRAFLFRHYAGFTPGWKGRDVLRLDTGSMALPETAQAVVEWVGQPR